MKFLESERVKKLLIGAAKDSANTGLELQFSVCKNKSGEYIPTQLRHGDRHQVSRTEFECPSKTNLVADIHTHPMMNLRGKGALQSQARLSYIDVSFVGKLKKTSCVAQKVKKTNEVVVKCMTPKLHKIMLDDLYRGNPSLSRTEKNDDELSRFFGRKMQFSEEKSKQYIKEKRYKLDEKPKKKKIIPNFDY